MGASTPVESAWGHEITIEQSTTPAGWYSDPAGSGAKRWWDGVQWTAHLQAATPAPAPAPAPPPAPTAMILHQPQQIDPQRVDPYAQSNPYGLPAVTERPYVPMQGGALPPVPMTQVHYAHNNAAIGSVVVGALAFCLSLVGVIPGAPFFYYSAGGILAIIGGARALARRRQGYGTVTWSPVLAIVLGSLAVILMLTGFGLHAAASSNVLYGTNYSQTQSGTGADTGTSSGSTTEALPAAPTFASDATLTQYETGVSQIANNIYGTYSNGQIPVAGMAGLPATLVESTQGVVTFPSGMTAGTLPADEAIKYVLSSDGKYFDVAVTGGNHTEIAIYDSQANQFTWVCDAGAPSSCPTGGLDPNSSSTGNTTSNS